MNVFTKDIDRFTDYIDKAFDRNPYDPTMAHLKDLVENNKDGSAFLQASEDLSNVDVGQFGVVCLTAFHDDPFDFSNEFFNKHDLVMTFNEIHFRIDVFCAKGVDPEQVAINISRRAAAKLRNRNQNLH